MNEYELKLSGGRAVSWDGASGEDAARRYADANRGARVVAWRFSRQPDIRVWGGARILRPWPSGRDA